MTLLAPLLLVGAIAAFAAALYLLSGSMAEARRFFPPQFQDDEKARYAVHTLVWDSAVPVRIRRKYFGGLVCASVAVGCIALLTALQGSTLSMVLFGAVFVFMAGATLTLWTKHRASL